MPLIRYNPVHPNVQTADLANVGRYQSNLQEANINWERDARQFSFQKDLAAQQIAQRQQESALQAQLQREGYGNQSAIARMQAEAAKYPHILKQQRWDQIFPSVQGILSGTSPIFGQFGSSYGGTGQQGQQPTINASPVYNNQQIQERVNDTRAQNDLSLASKQRANNQSMAGRGFGSRSPIAMAMNQAMFGQNLAANTQAENQLRFDAASANAKQLLAAQQAQEAQFASRQQEDIDRNKVRSGLISALFGSALGAI